ncbi:hypothetical protein P3S68_003586 [Capsicum galapagoense]
MLPPHDNSTFIILLPWVINFFGLILPCPAVSAITSNVSSFACFDFFVVLPDFYFFQLRPLIDGEDCNTLFDPISWQFVLSFFYLVELE